MKINQQNQNSPIQYSSGMENRKNSIVPKLINIQSINIQEIIKKLEKEGSLDIDFMNIIIINAHQILKNQSNLIRIESPVLVVGDIHGQFYDLLTIFKKYDFKTQKFLFLGDYVDRGTFCMEVVTLILLLKILYPKSIHLLRGNHEGRVMTSHFNFKIECCKKYNADIYEKIIDLFMAMPFSALVDDKYFCVHGGISPQLFQLNQLQKVYRFVEIPESGLLCDMLWSDPLDQDLESWSPNKLRCCSYFYSRHQSSQFLKNNKLQMIIRGHEVQMNGFKYQQNRHKNKFLTLTIFSAPNYCDTYKNKGSVGLIGNGKIQIDQYLQAEHPFVLPNYMNIFEWSMPFVSSSLNLILSKLIKTRKTSKLMKGKQFNDQMAILKRIDLINTIMNKQKLQRMEMMKKQQQNFNYHKKQEKNRQISNQDIIKFFLMKEKDISQKCPTAFGPKKLKFDKIASKKDIQQPQELNQEDF